MAKDQGKIYRDTLFIKAITVSSSFPLHYMSQFLNWAESRAVPTHSLDQSAHPKTTWLKLGPNECVAGLPR